jgi:hypothetical protein
MILRGLGCGLSWFRLGQGAHGFHELRVRFISDDHDVEKQFVLIEFAVVEMQGMECGDLKYPRFLDEHFGGVALTAPRLSVRGSGGGDESGTILGKAQAANQVMQ